MKIIAIGMNYVAHCHELHANENLPKEPVIFMKPDSALLKDSKPFFIPDFSYHHAALSFEPQFFCDLLQSQRNAFWWC